MANLRNFYGGMANDEYLVGENQCVYSENLDCYADPRFLQLASKPISVNTSLPEMALNLVKFSDKLYAFSADKAYNGTDNTLLYTATGSTTYPWNYAVYNEGTSYIYFGNQDGYVIDIGSAGTQTPWVDVGTNNLAGRYAAHWETPVNATESIFMGTYDHGSTNEGRVIYFDSTGFTPPVTTEAITSATKFGYMAGFTVHQDMLYNYVGYQAQGNRRGALIPTNITVGLVNTQNFGTKYFDDPFIQVLPFYKYDILVSGRVEAEPDEFNRTYKNVSILKNGGIGEGSDALYARSKYYSKIASAFTNNGWTFYWVGEANQTNANYQKMNDLLFTVQTKDDESVMYTYGQGLGGLPDASMVYMTKNSQGAKLKKISGLTVGTQFGDSDKLYFAWQDVNDNFGIDYLEIPLDGVAPANYQPEGKVFLRTDDGGDLGQKKEVLKVKVGCIIPADTTLVLSYILDDGTEVEYYTLTSTSEGTSTVKDIEINKPIRGFREISWLVKFTGGTATPKLYNFDYQLGAMQ